MAIHLSTDEQLYRDFWKQLKRHLRAQNRGVEPLGALARKWMDLEIDAKPGIAVASLDNCASGLQTTFQLRGKRSAEFYFRLRDQRLAVEYDIGCELDWAGDTKEGLPPWQTQCYKNNCDLTELHRWPEYIDWYADMALRFKNCFAPRMEALLAESPEQMSSSEKRMYRNYWTQFSAKLRLRDASIRPISSLSRSWLDLDLDSQGSVILPSFGIDGLDGIETTFRLLAKQRGPQLLRTEARSIQYAKLLKERQAIEQELGFDLEWNGYASYNDGRYICYQIRHVQQACDIQDQDRWPEYIDWHIDQVLRLKKCFLPRVNTMIGVSPGDNWIGICEDEPDNDL